MKHEVDKMKYYGKIFFTMDKNHPDIKCVEDWTENKLYTFEDTYTFKGKYTKEEIMHYIKRDLMLVAGGGYNTEHIHGVEFRIKELL